MRIAFDVDTDPKAFMNIIRRECGLYIFDDVYSLDDGGYISIGSTVGPHLASDNSYAKLDYYANVFDSNGPVDPNTEELSVSVEAVRAAPNRSKIVIEFPSALEQSTEALLACMQDQYPEARVQLADKRNEHMERERSGECPFNSFSPEPDSVATEFIFQGSPVQFITAVYEHATRPNIRSRFVTKGLDLKGSLRNDNFATFDIFEPTEPRDHRRICVITAVTRGDGNTRVRARVSDGSDSKWQHFESSYG